MPRALASPTPCSYCDQLSIPFAFTHGDSPLLSIGLVWLWTRRLTNGEIEATFGIDVADRRDLIGIAATGRPLSEHNADHRIDTVFHTVARDQNDALNLLFDAATYESSSTHETTSHSHHANLGNTVNAKMPCNANMSASVSMDSSHAWCMQRHPLSNLAREVQLAWQACPFVKKKWMTAQEAVTYVDLFFRNMAPMSPILDGYFADHANHHELVVKEPILCCTILTLSTRYHLLTGVASLSRGFILHERLWDHCQSLLQRVVWGEGPRMVESRGAIGTIESFLLLTEWHPRSFLSRHRWIKDSGMEWPEDDEPSEKSSSVLPATYLIHGPVTN
jgi:hypothetical protein